MKKKFNLKYIILAVFSPVILFLIFNIPYTYFLVKASFINAFPYQKTYQCGDMTWAIKDQATAQRSLWHMQGGGHPTRVFKQRFLILEKHGAEIARAEYTNIIPIPISFDYIKTYTFASKLNSTQSQLLADSYVNLFVSTDKITTQEFEDAAVCLNKNIHEIDEYLTEVDDRNQVGWFMLRDRETDVHIFSRLISSATSYQCTNGHSIDLYLNGMIDVSPHYSSPSDHDSDFQAKFDGLLVGIDGKLYQPKNYDRKFDRYGSGPKMYPMDVTKPTKELPSSLSCVDKNGQTLEEAITISAGRITILNDKM